MLADALSRAVQPSPRGNQCSLHVEVHAIEVLAMLVSETTQDWLGTKTEKDPKL